MLFEHLKAVWSSLAAKFQVCFYFHASNTTRDLIIEKNNEKTYHDWHSGCDFFKGMKLYKVCIGVCEIVVWKVFILIGKIHPQIQSGPICNNKFEV